MTAWHHWSAMHAWWCARRDEREPIGKPWAPKGSPKKSSGSSHIGSRASGGDRVPAQPDDQETGAAPGPTADRREPAASHNGTAAPVSDPFDGIAAPTPYDDERRALVARVNALAGEHGDRLREAAIALQLKLSKPELWPVERFGEIDIALREIELAVGPDPFEEEFDEPVGRDSTQRGRWPMGGDGAPRMGGGEPTEGHRTPDEGPQVGPGDVEALRKAFNALEPNDKAWVESLLREARAAGVPFGALGDNPTLRRFELGGACVTMACELPYMGGFDYAKPLLALALGEEPQPAPLGALIGSLSAPEAVRFAKVVDAFVDGRLVASFDDEGRMNFAHAS